MTNSVWTHYVSFLKSSRAKKPGAKNPGGARKANPAGTASAKARQAMTLTRQNAAAKATFLRVIGIFHLTSESVAGVVLLLWQAELYIVTGLGPQEYRCLIQQIPYFRLVTKGREHFFRDISRYLW